jgi:hypothetical protein
LSGFYIWHAPIILVCIVLLNQNRQNWSMTKIYAVFYISILILFSCKKAYNPPLKNIPNAGFLVVEGSINTGSDSTFFKLSRTVPVSSTVTSNPELNAVVTIENDQNFSYPLTEKGNGIYAYAGLNVDNSHKYRLNIKTANNEQYVSDFDAPLNSPPIDSVSYDVNGNVTGPGLNVYVSTHDPTNTVKYYLWDYQETWQFHSAFNSSFVSNGYTVSERNLADNQIFTCWKSDTSSFINLASSVKLSKDVIVNNPITFVASTDERVGIDYSILVRQYALTPDAYNFYNNLKKNTEQLGSIFDAEPSEVSGNIHCVTNPSEPVIGYVSVGVVASKRIFANNRNLPAWGPIIPFYNNCALFFDAINNRPCCYFVSYGPTGIVSNQVDAFINYDVGGDPYPLIPIDQITEPFGGPALGYTASTKECTDCTVRGTNVAPSYWQ